MAQSRRRRQAKLGSRRGGQLTFPKPAFVDTIEVIGGFGKRGRRTEEEHTLQEAAATALGVSLSEFYRRAARESAKEVLAERSRIVLNQAEAERFLDALDHPGRFEAAMSRLAARPSVIPKP